MSNRARRIERELRAAGYGPIMDQKDVARALNCSTRSVRRTIKPSTTFQRRPRYLLSDVARRLADS